MQLVKHAKLATKIDAPGHYIGERTTDDKQKWFRFKWHRWLDDKRAEISTLTITTMMKTKRPCIIRFWQYSTIFVLLWNNHSVSFTIKKYRMDKLRSNEPIVYTIVNDYSSRNQDGNRKDSFNSSERFVRDCSQSKNKSIWDRIHSINTGDLFLFCEIRTESCSVDEKMETIRWIIVFKSKRLAYTIVSMLLITTWYYQDQNKLHRNSWIWKNRYNWAFEKWVDKSNSQNYVGLP